MQISMHPKAFKQFNRRIQELGRLIETKDMTKSPSKGRFTPELHADHVLSSADIVSMGTTTLTLPDGTISGMFQKTQGGAIGFWSKSVDLLCSLAEEIQDRKELRDVVCTKSVRDHIFTWVLENNKGADCGNPIGYLLGEVGKSINVYDVWIPIFDASIEGELKLGDIRLFSCDDQVINKWESHWRKQHPPKGEEQAKHFANYFHRIRKLFKGRAVAACKVTGEPDHACLVAESRASESLACLRLLTEGALFPLKGGQLVPAGRELTTILRTVPLRNGVFEGMRESSEQGGRRMWVMSKTEQEQSHPILARLDSLLSIETKTDFQARLLNALSLYGTAASLFEPIDKLVYIFASLESLLINNEDEPILANMPRRLAVLVGRPLEERKRIQETAKKVYGARSKFMHHGSQTADLKAMHEFMVYCQRFLIELVVEHEKYKSKAEFISKLEDRLLS